uniref:Uncharacterized protein n=1 Tax=Acrobeloides nanus TaxID=290746 RepID=A0A914DP12_9BILA
MVRKWCLILLFLRVIGLIKGQHTPTIGASCKLGVAEVQIGGKNTQFFLKCEPNPDAPAQSEGIWVVRSRSSLKKHDPSPPFSDSHAGVAHSDLQKIQESLENFYRKSNSNQIRKHRKPEGPPICDQDFQAREGLRCTATETCLQQSYDDPVAYLQCETVSRRWTKRYCQDGYSFSYPHQACIGQAKRNTAETQSNNVFNSYKNNGGFASNTLDLNPNQPPLPEPQPIDPMVNDGQPQAKGKAYNRLVSRQAVLNGVSCTYSNCNDNNPCIIGTCNNGYCCSSGSSQVINVGGGCGNGNCGNNQAIVICPGGGTSYGQCYNNQCSSGYSCINNYCCPSSSSSSSSVSACLCPNCAKSSGQCYGGFCQSSGTVCYQNTNSCCPQLPVCPDGTQAAGACVNNQCGTGFTCRNGLCCVSNSNVPRCLDGSIAVGACIDCECGPGYTCTTANLCCPAPAMCPTGQVSIGPCVNTQCPTNYTCVGNFPNDNCCGAAPSTALCLAIDSIGPCINNACDAGFTCDTTQQVCCPNLLAAVGPCLNSDVGACPIAAYCQQSTQMCFTLSGGSSCPDSPGPCGDNGAGFFTVCPTGFSCLDPTQSTVTGAASTCCYLYGAVTN